MNIYQVQVKRGDASRYHPRTIAAMSEADAIAAVLSEHPTPVTVVSADGITSNSTPPTVESVRLVTVPRVLHKCYERRRKARDESRAKVYAIDKAYTRANFAHVSVELSHMFRHGDVSNLGEYADSLEPEFTEYYFGRHGANVSDEVNEARELVRYICPDMPARVLDVDALDLDVRRAMCSAAESDYLAQFWRWCVSEVESAADSIGLPWAYLDDKGEPTAYAYEATALGFACSRRLYLRGGDWEPQQSWETQREYMERAEDVLGEYVAGELHNKINPEYFDERGGRYADPEDWPEQFIETTDAVQTWESSRDKMRARLRDMMRNRAPLEQRAALVATVYGNPGTDIEDENA